MGQPMAENVFRAGFREFNRLTQGDKADPDAVMEGVDRAMRVACPGKMRDSMFVCHFSPALPR